MAGREEKIEEWTKIHSHFPFGLVAVPIVIASLNRSCWEQGEANCTGIIRAPGSADLREIELSSIHHTTANFSTRACYITEVFFGSESFGHLSLSGLLFSSNYFLSGYTPYSPALLFPRRGSEKKHKQFSPIPSLRAVV